jgi:quinol-cytochrome oxidoreductase complex cytochrome b subunit
VLLLGVSLVHTGLVVLYGQFGSWVNYEPEGPDEPPPTLDEVESYEKLKHEILDPRSKKVNLPNRTTWFFPNHMFKEAVVSLAILLVIIGITILFPAPIAEPVDPVSTGFTPSSMWFWLFLDQMLVLFPGQWFIAIGVVVAPTIVLVLLVLLPWLDRNPRIAPWDRPVAITFMFILVAAVFILGMLAASRVFNYEFIVGGPH